MTAIYAPVAVPSTNLPPPPPGQVAHPAIPLSIEQQWRNTESSWNERALDRINKNRARLGMKPIRDVLAYVLADHTWLAADVDGAKIAARELVAVAHAFSGGSGSH